MNDNPIVKYLDDQAKDDKKYTDDENMFIIYPTLIAVIAGAILGLIWLIKQTV